MNTTTVAQVKASDIARAAHISPRTKRFVLRDEYGYAYDGTRTEHVLAAFQRSDHTPDIDSRTRTVALGLWKCYITGRMNVELARRVREQYTPHQLCALLARIANEYQGEPTIGMLADTWVNQHATEL